MGRARGLGLRVLGLRMLGLRMLGLWMLGLWALARRAERRAWDASSPRPLVFEGLHLGSDRPPRTG
ncbi:MAG: hypothetical protein CMN29_15925 [Sandaracinus sp.]|nr:hypothetical protein [Sandaracinus sp.]